MVRNYYYAQSSEKTQKMIQLHIYVLIFTGICTTIACFLSSYLIYMHQRFMTRLTIQPKIVGIVWMVPIYAVNSWISLWNPSYAPYIDMLRDCYEV